MQNHREISKSSTRQRAWSKLWIDPVDLDSLCIQVVKENKMPQSTHDRAAELHNLAAHAHSAAATAHGKGDHLTAHELSKQALEHSRNAHKHSEELASDSAQ